MSLLLPSKRPKKTAQGPLLPATITAITPTMATVDGAATPIYVLRACAYTPAVNDRVALIQFGSNYLAFKVDT